MCVLNCVIAHLLLSVSLSLSLSLSLSVCLSVTENSLIENGCYMYIHVCVDVCASGVKIICILKFHYF